MFAELTLFARSCLGPFIYVIFMPPHAILGKWALLAPFTRGEDGGSKRLKDLHESEKGQIHLHSGLND